MTNGPKILSKRSRDRLLALAAWLESIATRIRGYAAARTPRRPRKVKAAA